MEILWDKGRATVSDVVEALAKRMPLAYATDLTTLRILEQKGYLTHIKESRAFVYEPLVARDEACETAITHLVRRFFDGSHELLALRLIEQRRVDPKELQRLRKKIQDSE